MTDQWDLIAKGLGAEPCEGGCGRLVYPVKMPDENTPSMWEPPRGSNEVWRHTPERCRARR